MILKIFGDHTSQPCRAVFVFCKINKIPFELVEIRVNRFDHLSEQYEKINPLKKVPAISHNGFNLAQSHSIMRYLSKVYNTPENWYPRSNFAKTAKIDEYLDYHHSGTRKCGFYIFNKVFSKNLGVEPAISFNQQESRNQFEQSIKFINDICLKNTPYIYSEEVSIADLSAYEEILQLKFIEYDFSKYIRVLNWMKQLQKIKEVEQENQIFNKILNAYFKKQKAKL